MVIFTNLNRIQSVIYNHIQILEKEKKYLFPQYLGLINVIVFCCPIYVNTIIFARQSYDFFSLAYCSAFTKTFDESN